MKTKDAMRWAVASVSAVLAACASAPAPVGRPLTESRIEFPGFSVGVPTGSGWGVNRNDQKQYVEFMKTASGFGWSAGADSQRISSFRVSKLPIIQGGGPLPDEQALADEYISIEEKDLRVNVMGLTDYKMKTVGKGEKTVGDRRVHWFRYETGGFSGGGMGPYFSIDGQMYVYFPPNYEKDGAAYTFLASVGCKKCTSALSADENAQVDQLLNSLVVGAKP